MERTSVMRGPTAKGGAVMDIQNFDIEMQKTTKRFRLNNLL